MTFAGIKPYLYGIRNWALSTGKLDLTRHHGNQWHKLQSLLAGIKRPTFMCKRVRKPLKVSQIRKIVESLGSSHLNTKDRAAFKAALLLAFFGFMRSSEYSVTSTNLTLCLRRKDIKIYPKYKKNGVIRLKL